jgi:hypothetical protein
MTETRPAIGNHAPKQRRKRLVKQKVETERRLAPRYPAQHEAEGASPGGRITFRGLLHDLSATGCQLLLGTHLPRGTAVEFQCDIAGIGVWLRGKIVWSNPAVKGTFHGVRLTGFGSQGDALFYRLHIRRVANCMASSPKVLDRPNTN